MVTAGRSGAMKIDEPDPTRAMVRQAVADGIREVLADRALVSDFWEAGYTQLLKHASAEANQWVGRRILTTVAVAVLAALVVWLVRTGRLTP